MFAVTAISTHHRHHNHSKWLWMATLISSSARTFAALYCLGRSSSDSERSLDRHRSAEARLRCTGTRVLLEARLILFLLACRNRAFSEPSPLPSATSLSSSSELQTECLDSSSLIRLRCCCFFSHLERCPPSAEGTLYSFQQPRQRKVGWHVIVLALYLTLFPFLRLRSKQRSLETLCLCQFLKKNGWGYFTCSLFLIMTSMASYCMAMLRWSWCLDCLGVSSSFFGFTRKYSSGFTDLASFFTVPLRLAESASSFTRSSRQSSPPSRSCSNSPKGFLPPANWTRTGLSVELWLSTLRAELSPCSFSGVTIASPRSKLTGSGQSQSSVLAGWCGNLGLLGLMQMMSSEEEWCSMAGLQYQILYTQSVDNSLVMAYILLVFLFQIKSNKMKRSSRSRTKPQRTDGRQELNQYYLKEILRNIENIQTTILRKLNTQHQQQEEKIATRTPSRREAKVHSLNSAKREEGYHSLQATPKRPKKTACKEPKPEYFATISPEQAKHEALKKISQNQLSLLNKTTHFASNRPQVTLLKTREERERTQEHFNTVRLKQSTPSNKENHFFSLSKTERTISINPPAQIEKSIQRAQPTQTARTFVPCPQNDIQKFYKLQIQRLQLQQQIRQLQQQLQRCLSCKKAANLCEFQFLRSKMKRISVEINELKDKRSRLAA